MARFGGNEFSSFSVPLVFDGRYFVLEPGNPVLLSVFIEREGKLIFEVLKNKGLKSGVSEKWGQRTAVKSGFREQYSLIFGQQLSKSCFIG